MSGDTINQTGSKDYNFNVPGVILDNSDPPLVILGPPSNWGDGCCCAFSGYVSADDYVAVRITNCCGSTDCHLTASTWKVNVR